MLEAFDSVLMLTWSDWKSEPRSNRYHYASRLARHLPVFFVQPDLLGPANKGVLREEPTELANVTIWHIDANVIAKPGPVQKRLLAEALARAGARRPLLWIYNTNFENVIPLFYGSFKLYHATEDYFSEDEFPHAETFRDNVRRVLAQCDLVVSVSEGVAQSYRERGRYRGEMLTLPNGVDFSFYAANPHGVAPADKKTVLFQGGINRRVDFALLESVANRLPDWEFRFCGRTDDSYPPWQAFKQHKNVVHLGQLGAESVRDECYRAHVGIIPYVQTPNAVERSLPIKAFEYVAAGLPVVSVPVRALERFTEFHFAADAEAFAAAIAAAAVTRTDSVAVARRRETARLMDYELRFESLVSALAERAGRRPDAKKNVLVLYDMGSTHVTAIKEHLESFGQWSKHHVWYAGCTGQTPCAYDLDAFDAVVIHYSVRVSLPNHLSPAYAEALRRCRRQKLLFIQDEYDTTDTAKRWIRELAIDVVFTCVPGAEREKVYPSAAFAGVRFVENLTGYVPEAFERAADVPPPGARKIVLGYRGRALPYWYGDLGQEKLEIGRQMRRLCAERVPVDIEWEDAHRIYGPHWYTFVRSCRAMLGTESGANVFDFTGELRSGIEAALAARPKLTYAEARARFLEGHEGRVRMNQVSPKIFEAIAFRTALVLFEGEYSGVVRANEHYIPLKKDYSNVDEVIARLNDIPFVEALVERAHRDVIASGRYSYRSFVAMFDAEVDARFDAVAPAELVPSVAGLSNAAGAQVFRYYSSPRHLASRVIVDRQVLEVTTEIEPSRKPIYDLPAALKQMSPLSLMRFALRNLFFKLPEGWRKPFEPLMKSFVSAVREWRRRGGR